MKINHPRCLTQWCPRIAILSEERPRARKQIRSTVPRIFSSFSFFKNRLSGLTPVGAHRPAGGLLRGNATRPQEELRPRRPPTATSWAAGVGAARDRGPGGAAPLASTRVPLRLPPPSSGGRRCRPPPSPRGVSAGPRGSSPPGTFLSPSSLGGGETWTNRRPQAQHVHQ